jgi:DNA uptake protein ComE-like DNA-binding protein
VDERSKRPFESLQDLDRRVVGIGPATIRALTPFLQFRNPP